MAATSAGILLFREIAGTLEVLLVHPGGPFWTNKDDGAWSIPKGEFAVSEDPLAAAKREFAEELGTALSGPFVELGCVRQSSAKTVYAWGIRGDFDPANLKSNTFTMEWPPKSGRQQEFPEVDRAAWFTLDVARDKIHRGQRPFLDRLEKSLQCDDTTQ